MKSIIFLIFLGLLSGASACRFESNDPYTQSVKRARFSKDSFYKASDQSPFNMGAKRELVALKYYEPDSTYRVMATLTLFPHPDSVKMQVTNNGDQDYFKLGTIHFNLKGHDCKLSVYQNAKMMSDTSYKSDLFCPFTDETNGKKTHEGGRFLDLTKIEGSDKVLVDFNYCYNPYCAYNDKYSCPIPPAENHLDFKVKAGEKAFLPGSISWFK